MLMRFDDAIEHTLLVLTCKCYVHPLDSISTEIMKKIMTPYSLFLSLTLMFVMYL